MADSPAFDRGRLEGQLEPAVLGLLQSLSLFDVIDSTNTFLMAEESPRPGAALLAAADYQTHGRGRHNRRWETAAGSSLCMSLAYTFEDVPTAPGAVTLLMGVAVAEALSGLGIVNIQLKWPNDIVYHDSKLGGLLAESKMKAGAMTVVAGVGINVALDEEIRLGSGSRWAARATDLRAVTGGEVDRTILLANVANRLLLSLREFDQSGIGQRLDEWRSRDWLRGKLVAVESGARLIEGVASGIDDDGALLVETAAGPERVVSGSVAVEMDHASTAP